MSTAQTYPALTIDSTGTAFIAGSRYKVLHLAAEHYQHGWTAEEILRQHPDLTPAQVYAALAYFYEHRDSLLLALNSTAEQTRNRSQFSRDELRKRLTP